MTGKYRAWNGEGFDYFMLGDSMDHLDVNKIDRFIGLYDLHKKQDIYENDILVANFLTFDGDGGHDDWRAATIIWDASQSAFVFDYLFECHDENYEQLYDVNRRMLLWDIVGNGRENADMLDNPSWFMRLVNNTSKELSK